ncbi:MAG: LPXTG cell wall anchor domain-containing protein, partial [Tyzzerella sp.]|nr:LPXTG cell wall anchor domain-containing protein [Tyzzerella sp.]
EDIKYYVVETKAAPGYIANETVHEVVFRYEKEAPEVVIYELSVTNKPIVPDSPKTGDDSNPFVYAGICVAGLGLVVLALLKKKKEK